MSDWAFTFGSVFVLGMSLLFWLFTLGLLALPFYPAWREWRHPSDDTPLAWPLAAQGPVVATPVVHSNSHQWPNRPARTPASHTAFTPPNAQPWGAQGWRVQGDCQLPKGSYLPGSLVVTGQLLCGPDSVVEGDVKAHGLIRLDPGCLLMGALVGHTDISVGPDAEVFGPVLAQGTVRLAARARIGRSEYPTSLSAQRLLAHRQAVVHGLVFAPETESTP